MDAGLAARYGGPHNVSKHLHQGERVREGAGSAESGGDGERHDVVFSVLGESRSQRDGSEGMAAGSASGSPFHDDPLALQASRARPTEPSQDDSHGADAADKGRPSREADMHMDAATSEAERMGHGARPDAGGAVDVEGGLVASAGSRPAWAGDEDQMTTRRRRVLLQGGDAVEQGEGQAGHVEGYAFRDLRDQTGQEFEVPVEDADKYERYDDEAGDAYGEDVDDEEMEAETAGAVQETGDAPDGLWLLGLVAGGLITSLVHALTFALVIYGGPSLLQACESLRLASQILVAVIWVDGALVDGAGEGGSFSPSERGAGFLLVVLAGGFVIRYCSRWARGWGTLQVPIAVYNLVSLGDIESSVTRQMGNVEKKFSIASIAPSPSLFSPTPAAAAANASDGPVPQRWACDMFVCRKYGVLCAACDLLARTSADTHAAVCRVRLLPAAPKFMQALRKLCGACPARGYWGRVRAAASPSG